MYTRDVSQDLRRKIRAEYSTCVTWYQVGEDNIKNYPEGIGHTCKRMHLAQSRRCLSNR
jgi:hypothetical protein